MGVNRIVAKNLQRNGSLSKIKVNGVVGYLDERPRNEAGELLGLKKRRKKKYGA